MTRWIALVPDNAGQCGYLVEGDRVLRHATGSSEEAVLAELGDAPRMVRLGDGPPDRLPTGILPKTGDTLSALEQATPPDIISASVRLWIAGALASRVHWDGVICATQSDVTHWIHISAGEAVSVQTVLTPRLVTALGGTASADPDALADTLSRPERLAAHLRQAEISGDRAALTGHLLGAELAATRPYWLGQEVLVISAKPAPHMTALAAQGVPATALAPGDLVASGLAALSRALGLTDG
ncbi:2-keto-3-deoxy-galactonokinase [Roseovarius sp. THAF8]|uniref:2-dehydro-3-deoxygalactonokinase n=1 Tax=Roseovarius sp. THAF8 TaxID=2587846 RepID=UPI001267D16E|nr:2-dehydro-3-deoxygalactonokinase [Roseovarius sp. THAF8]QFT97580.1 2-keto-3-deoxy-galactonokinase [Roseovarius sp. THAF8]